MSARPLGRHHRKSDRRYSGPAGGQDLAWGRPVSGRYHHPANYWDFQVFIQRICLKILGQFREAGVAFAFPSQTVYAAGDDKRPLKMMLTDVVGVSMVIPERY
jgi:hypothetical protein